MIRVVIVDDQKVVTQGLKALLESEPDIQIVGTGANGKEAIHLVSTLLPDVLLIDHYMPVMNGVEATQTITEQFPAVAVLLLSGSDQDDHIAEALQAGAKGYLLKSTSSEDLANSIRSVDRGYSQMGPGLLEKLLAKINAPAASSSSAAPLKPTAENLLSADLAQILSIPSHFDVLQMDSLLAAIRDVSVAAALMTQLERQLQQQPSHVSALYLSGQFICKFQQRNQRAMNYFRLAFTHARNQSFALAALLQVCRGAWVVDSTETLSWLTDILKNWPKDQPSQVLFETMSQVFKPGTDPYRQLRAIWEIQHLALLCEQVNALKSKLSALDFSA